MKYLNYLHEDALERLRPGEIIATYCRKNDIFLDAALIYRTKRCRPGDIYDWTAKGDEEVKYARKIGSESKTLAALWCFGEILFRNQYLELVEHSEEELSLA